MQKWRDEDHLALECLLRVGGDVSAVKIGEEMQATTMTAWLALNRLVWRGVVEMGPLRAGLATWRLHPNLNTEES